MPIRRRKPKAIPLHSTPSPSKGVIAEAIQSSTDHEHAPRNPENGSQDNKASYKNPPKSSQFKPGRSGNPKGRPKGTKNLKNLVLALLNERVAVKTQNGVRKMTKMEALLHKQMEKASKGDDKAFKIFLNLYGEALADQMAAFSASGKEENITASDRAVLNLFLQQNAAKYLAGGCDEN